MTFRKLFALIGLFTLTSASAAFAADGAPAGGGGVYNALAAALAIGMGVLGGALGQGKAATAALEGIARNPAAQGKIFVPMIISLALIESLVLLAFLIAFVKIPV